LAPIGGVAGVIEEDCTKRNLLADGAITVDRTIIFNTAVNYRLKRQVWPW
jgi:hypothetical protein